MTVRLKRADGGNYSYGPYTIYRRARGSKVTWDVVKGSRLLATKRTLRDVRKWLSAPAWQRALHMILHPVKTYRMSRVYYSHWRPPTPDPDVTDISERRSAQS